MFFLILLLKKFLYFFKVVFTKTEDIGIIILTYSSFKEIKEEVLEFKLTGELPLVVTIPDLDGEMEDDFILKYVRESVGVKAVGD